MSSIPDGTAYVADVDIAGPARARSLVAGRRSKRHTVGTPGADAAEYLQLAVKRWQYYFAEGFSPHNLEDAKRPITDAPECELGFLLTARVRDTARIEAGFCFLRRVWTGRFVVDFLSVHPRTFDLATGSPGITGIGAGLLASAAKVTLDLGGTGFWGEATQNSHGFYQRMKQKVRRTKEAVAVTDHFRFEAEPR